MKRIDVLLVALGAAVVLYGLSRTKRGGEMIANLIGSGMDKARKLIVDEEGESLEVYLDNATPPVWTVGTGHKVLSTDVVRGQKIHPYGPIKTITQSESDAFLKNDSAMAIQDVDNGVRVLVNTNQRAALISLRFNIGSTAFRDSTLLRLLNAGDFQGAADQFSRWIYSGRKDVPNPVLVKRRERERGVFLT